MRSRTTLRKLAPLVRGSSRPDTVIRSRPAHLRVTSRRCRRAGRRSPAPSPPSAKNRYSPKRPLTRASISDRERLHAELARAVDGEDRDREVLVCRPGRVEARAVAPPRAPGGAAGEHGSELCPAVAGDQARLDSVGDVARVARLLPVVAENVGPRQLG